MILKVAFFQVPTYIHRCWKGRGCCQRSVSLLQQFESDNPFKFYLVSKNLPYVYIT